MPVNPLQITAPNPQLASFNEIERRRALAKQLAGTMPAENIRSTEQGIAHVIGKVGEAYQNYKANKMEKDRTAALAQALGPKMQEMGLDPSVMSAFGGEEMARMYAQMAMEEARARREAEAQANDPMRQLQIQKLQRDVNDDGRPWWAGQGGQVDPAYMAAQTATRAPAAVSAPPSGYQNVFDQQGNLVRQAPIPGGPADMDAQKAEAAKKVQQETEGRYGGIVLEDIGRAREAIQNAPWYSPGAGLGAEFLRDNIGGSNAANIGELLKTVQANIGFDRLQKMRESSPTGGALGQVTERELAFLQATLGSLSQSQDPEQLVANLNRLEQTYNEVMRKFSAYPNAAEFGIAPAEASQQGGSIDDLLKKYGGQ